MIQDPLYGGLRFVPAADSPHWRTVDLGMWTGQRAYIEFADTSTPVLHDLAPAGIDPNGNLALGLAVLQHDGAPANYTYAELDRAPAPDAPHFLAPIDAQEVWAAGVTYTRSREARMEESEASADVYARVYDAARPEIFFKATPSRVAGPHAPVAVREDATWTVPEPELTVLLDARLAVGTATGAGVYQRDLAAAKEMLPDTEGDDREVVRAELEKAEATMSRLARNASSDVESSRSCAARARARSATR